MTDHALTTALWMLTAIFAAGVVAGFRWADRRRVLADLVARPCPKCGETYGAEILNTLSKVRYRWTLMRGNTVATLGVPRHTYLIVCPACKAEIEFNEKGRVFIHPQVGVLSFMRTVHAPTASPVRALPQATRAMESSK